MKIRSNHITRNDIRDAAQTIPSVLHEVRQTFQPRNFNYGYDVVLFSSRLEGRPSAGMPGWKAATWDEFGIFIDQLFAIDPDAEIAWYKGYEDFIVKTRAEYERCAEYRPQDNKRAPWLVNR